MNPTPNQVPPDVVATVQRAAKAVPGHSGDLDAVRSRGRNRRHRRAAGGGLLAVAAAAALAAPFVLQEPASDIPPLIAPAGPAQRLLLNGEGWLAGPAAEMDAAPELDGREQYEFYQDRPGVEGVLRPVGEVLPDGQVIEFDLELPGVSGFNDVVDMPGGRLAVLGYTEPAPDGPCFEGVALRLLVLGADRSVEQAREVACGSVLVAADADAAYLVRDESRLFRHDLGTGAETALIEAPELLGVGPPGSGGVSVAGGRAVRAYAEVGDALCAVDGPAAAVRLEVTELASGKAAEYGVPGEGCREPAKVRVSPDGRHVALAYYRHGDGAEPVELEIAVVDLDSGAVTQTWAGDARGAERGDERIVDLAWDDEQTLLLAWYEEPGDGVHWLPDILQVETVVLP